METYREQLWVGWQAVPVPVLEEIPANRAELMARVAPSRDPFDGGRTADWLRREGLTWRAVRDAQTGHTIHCVSDRPALTLTRDFALGLRLLAWMSTGAPIVWYWWDHAWPRRLPADVDPGRDHVNGGWAVPGVREVHVYRREEAHKVMLHECVHALGLDVPQSAVEPVRRRFEQAFGRRLWPHFGEAYTELFAEWLWAVAGARSLVGARRRWDAQVACASRQAVEVWARVRDSHEDENTNVFAYYVMKWVLLRDPEHLAVALLSPTHAVGHWWSWWLEARGSLEAAASAAATTEHQELPMGMTCGAPHVV
jgi:hypothetical protein